MPACHLGSAMAGPVNTMKNITARINRTVSSPFALVQALLGLIIIADSVSIYDIRPLRFARKKRLLLVEYFSFFRL